jgi:hypothetical protein
LVPGYPSRKKMDQGDELIGFFFLKAAKYPGRGQYIDFSMLPPVRSDRYACSCLASCIAVQAAQLWYHIYYGLYQCTMLLQSSYVSTHYCTL